MIGIGIGIPIINRGISGTAPVNTVAPILSGLNMVGETLTCTSGTWTGTPPISYIYSFYRNGSTLLQIGSSNTYVPVSADAGQSISCLVDATSSFGSGFAGSNSLSIVNMDLINLQSYDPAKFTLSGSQITAWTEQDGVTQWTQGTAADRPLLTGGVPTFAGNGDALVRATDVSATSYTFFCVVRNTTEATVKSLFGSVAGANWTDIGNSNFQTILKIAGVDIYRSSTGYKGKRDTIICIHRNANTITIYINNKRCLQTFNNFAGQPTLFGRLMSIAGFGSFALAGTLKAFCVTSSVLSTSATQDTINALYDKYNLSANTAADSIRAFGDSNTVGSGSTSYAYGLASSMGLGTSIDAVSGSIFTSATNASFYEILVSRPMTDYLVMQYCTNDILQSVPVATYQTKFLSFINDLINVYGWNPSKICLVTPPYQRDNANAAALDQYAALYLSTATTYGTKSWDFLSWMRANGGNSLLVDNVHVTQTAQNAMQAGVYAAFTS